MTATGSQQMKSGSRIDDIEVLRALAVLWVLVHHVRGGLLVWTSPALDRFYAYFNGSHGVDLFFAISGFVIARDLIPRLQGCAADRTRFFEVAIAFWIRRAFRLIPSAWVCLLFVALFSLMFNESGAFGSFRANFAGIVAAMLQVANLHFAHNFGSQLGLGSTYHFWSLSLEEQFYLALPFMIFFGRRAFPWIIAALVLVQLVSVRPSLYHWMLRTDAMFLGVLLAWWSRSAAYALFEPVFLRNRAWARWFTLLFLVGALPVVGAEALRIVEHHVSIVALISVLLVFIASYDRDYLMMPGAIKRMLLWLGSRSYAVYLWHVPVYALVRECAFRYGQSHAMSFDARHTWLFLAIAAALLIVVSEINFRLIEVPLRRRGLSAAQRWTASRGNTPC